MKSLNSSTRETGHYGVLLPPCCKQGFHVEQTQGQAMLTQSKESLSESKFNYLTFDE